MEKKRIRLTDGMKVTLHNDIYKTCTHGFLVGSATSDYYDTYTLSVDGGKFRSEGKLTVGWV